MEEDHPVQFVAFQHGPAPPLGRVHLVVAVPRPFDGGLAVPHRVPAVHDAPDVAELELAAALLVKLDEASDFFVEVLLVPVVIETMCQRPRNGDTGFGFFLAIRSSLGLTEDYRASIHDPRPACDCLGHGGAWAR